MCDNQDTELPKNLKFGKAAKNGDCFFDSVAQGLKQIKPEAELTIKSLREICKEYAQSQLKDKHSWLNEALSNEKEQINEYISCIEFTAIDIEQGSANTLRLRSPIWGRPDIEGRIICEKHNIELHIIEKCNLFDGKVMWAHQIVNKLGSKFLKKWYGNDGNTIHIATQGNEHFDPILRVKEVEVKIPTKKEEVQKKLILFVENFVFLYEKYISEHYERLENRTEKQGKWTSFINKVIDKGKGSEGVIKTVGIKTSVGVGINVLQSMMASLDISDNRKELKKLVNQLYFFKENKSRATEELIKAGIDIFQSFECQFVQVTANGSWERAMAKLAEDAVSKVIDYSKNNPEEGFSASFITKGVILGKSKTYKHTSTSAPHIKPGHTLQNGSFIWNTSKVFDTAGLVTVKSDGASDDYYSRRDGKSNTNEYGYRLCFSWELQDLNVKYQEDTQPQEKYQYTLKLDKKAKENLKNEILNKINKAKEVSNQYIDRLEGSLKEAIKEVKQNAIENVKEIEHCISEDFDKLLGYIDSYYEQTKAKIIEKTDEIKQQNKRLHEESYQQNNKIAKFIKEGREENKKGFNYLSQKISNLADIGKNNGQAEEPIFFNVKGPIKSFTGRKQDLRNLHSKIQSGKCTVISQMATISGLGGVGKTELAREYVNQYYQSYDSN
ncbi:MAG: hypothetical protein QWI36_01755, partial [Wolbachia endosymbiont of Tyrophagus putrescentiae]|nr:hypothetical protein [Wolbachia endosymbiont of Tyrophagus putrescentiae]